MEERQAKLKNRTIDELVRSGVRRTSDLRLPEGDALKVVRFVQAVLAAHGELEGTRLGCLSASGIEDGEAFNARLRELLDKPAGGLTPEEGAELREARDKLGRFNRMFGRALDSFAELRGLRGTISFAAYRSLVEENRERREKGDRVPDYQAFRPELAGVLWDAPEETDEKATETD